jgi:hypothetical protein
LKQQTETEENDYHTDNYSENYATSGNPKALVFDPPIWFAPSVSAKTFTFYSFLLLAFRHRVQRCTTLRACFSVIRILGAAFSTVYHQHVSYLSIRLNGCLVDL